MQKSIKFTLNYYTLIVRELFGDLNKGVGACNDSLSYDIDISKKSKLQHAYESIIRT